MCVELLQRLKVRIKNKINLKNSKISFLNFINFKFVLKRTLALLCNIIIAKMI